MFLDPLISARVTLISTRVSAHCQAILLGTLIHKGNAADITHNCRTLFTPVSFMTQTLMLILNWQEPHTHMECHLGLVNHKGQEWAHKNQVHHYWSSALHRTAHRRAPCQQQTTSLHNVPLNQSAHYASVVPTRLQTSQLTPYHLKVGAGGHSYWTPMAWQERRNAPISPIWWNMPSQTPSSFLRPTRTTTCKTMSLCHKATVHPCGRTGTSEEVEYSSQ